MFYSADIDSDRNDGAFELSGQRDESEALVFDKAISCDLMFDNDNDDVDVIPLLDTQNSPRAMIAPF